MSELATDPRAAAAQHYARSLVDAIDPSLSVDEFGEITVKTVGDEVVQVIPMIFNDRIVISTDPRRGYDHGWCYDKGGVALVVARVWDPATEAEPPGYKKRATESVRRLSGETT